MKIEHGGMQFELPGDLRQKFIAYRRRVWSIKTAEGVCAVIVLAVVCYLAVFAADRLGESPAWLRGLLLAVAAAGLVGYLPWKLYRWVWRNRQLTQLARLMALGQPRVGDRLLGVIELVQNRLDRHASPALCRAAIQQVADDTREVDFLRHVPHPAHRQWAAAAGAMMIVAAGALLVPGAGINALQRWLLPWSAISRYTFAQLAELPERQVVAIGEPFELQVGLAPGTVWSPSEGRARYGGQSAIRARRTDEGFRFAIPAQTEPGELKIAIGDARHTIVVQPMSRPELKSLLAHIRLPAYLGYVDQQRDVRSGAISIVKGSHARFEALASRPLAEATVNGQQRGVEVSGDRLKSPEVDVSETTAQEFRWTDIEGLSAKAPFQLRIRGIDDRAPSIQCNELTTEKVILDEETLSFEVAATDDFGVRTVGVEWSGVEDPRRNPQPQKGEYVLAGGQHDAMALNAQGTFAPKSLGVTPQPIHLRVYAEDYLPGRPRVYSPVYRLYVLDREQHMIWVTQQLELWERQALEVRDEEQRLLETNQQLRQLSPEQLDSDATRQRIARQAAAERANANRLQNLTSAGEQLINEATRNPEFNVATLERWAQVMQVLQQLAKNQMPSVANLLSAASNAPKSSSAPKPPAAPSVSDSVRGAARDPEQTQQQEQPESEPQTPRPSGSLQLPQTILPGGPSQNSTGGQQPNRSADENLEQAVEEQQRLLAEFNRVMDELAQVLRDLQGSTFVKRLKAAADAELSIAAQLHEQLRDTFGSDAGSLADSNQQLLERLDVHQSDTARDVRLIQDDLAAYFDRTRQEKFKQVHDEMKQTQVVSNFKAMSAALADNQAGDTIAQAEYWSDQLDRWAEILVGPGCANCGDCPGGQGDSLPPAIVLEVLRILKGEVDLRDVTRVAEQTRPLKEPGQHAEEAGELRDTQDSLLQRTQLVIDQLERMQTDEGKNYGRPLRQLAVAHGAMRDASQLLAAPETGPPTIAAETEAIEALLITKRAKQGGGGGGGSTPGGGGGESAADVPSALAGLGDDLMTEQREVAQATGTTRGQIPEEFRAGLDAYFSALDGQEGG